MKSLILLIVMLSGITTNAFAEQWTKKQAKLAILDCASVEVVKQTFKEEMGIAKDDIRFISLSNRLKVASIANTIGAGTGVFAGIHVSRDIVINAEVAILMGDTEKTYDVTLNGEASRVKSNGSVVSYEIETSIAGSGYLFDNFTISPKIANRNGILVSSLKPKARASCALKNPYTRDKLGWHVYADGPIGQYEIQSVLDSVEEPIRNWQR